MSLKVKQRKRERLSSWIDTLGPIKNMLRKSEGSDGSTHSLDRLGLDRIRSYSSSDEPVAEPQTSTIPHEGFAKNDDWVGVQKVILSIFQGRKIPSIDRSIMYTHVRQLANSELGPFIYDYYRNQLMPRGMRILRQEVKIHSDGLLTGLEDVWNTFYKEILSDIKVTLHPIMIKEHNIRQLTLLGFRDFVLLKTDIEGYFEKTDDLTISPAIEQMLLVLQSVRICDPPSENYIRLERLVGRAVLPYLGYLGLYDGGSEPKVRSLNYGSVIQRSKRVTDEISLTRAPSIYQKRRHRVQKSSRVLTLETVSETTHRDHEKLAKQLASPVDSPPLAIKYNEIMRGRRGRRYSCDILMNT